MRSFLVLITLACAAASPSAADGSADVVFTATLDDEAITPGTVQYLDRAIRHANDKQAECLVIVVDTPGGLLTSTRRLIKQMMGSRVPVVVYVAPQGSRAASAGVFITMAGHVAAMASGTTIGAAHPVQVGGLHGRSMIDGKRLLPLERKAIGSAPENETAVFADVGDDEIKPAVVIEIGQA